MCFVSNKVKNLVLNPKKVCTQNLCNHYGSDCYSIATEFNSKEFLIRNKPSRLCKDYMNTLFVAVPKARSGSI